ncbi:MAG: hypothetical protein KDD73_08465 [Anaerolineales bacterium]|nr:hypothetical protein [Anaerolineales bacterium]MCB9126465.1 hypothetical protein [Ardenticatenales bacterium]MCB9171625.1 hypothetical protein [Ardenticatenales bacterium]
MANQEVYMDVNALLAIARIYKERGELVVVASRRIERLSTLLRDNAFAGRVGGAILSHHIDYMRPSLLEWARKSIQIGDDLQASVEAYQRGDEQGATRFY